MTEPPWGGAASRRIEGILVRLLALSRAFGLIQMLVGLAFTWPRFSGRGLAAALAGAVAVESAAVVAVCWRSGRIGPGSAVADVLFTAAALLAGAAVAGRADYGTWAYFVYPYSLVESLIAGVGLARLGAALPLALALAAAFLTSSAVVHGDPPANRVPDAIVYLANTAAAWFIVSELRRSARLLDAEHGLAVRQAGELTRASERVRTARLLHDRALQALEMLSRGDWIPDPVMRGHVGAEASWLRRFVEQGQQDGNGDLPAALREVLDRHVRLGLGIDLNDAQVHGGPPGRPELAPEAVTALAGAVDEALANVRKHAGVSRATVLVRPQAGGLGVSVVDHGRGFPAGARPGLGLRDSVRGRIREAGGRARIESEPGAGTRVELWVPATSDHQ